MPGEPTPSAPRVNYGKPQATTRIPKVKTVVVRQHTRTLRTNGGTAAPKTTGATAPAIDPTTKSLIDAAVRLKFGGQEQGLNQQLAANTRFANGAPAWYQQAVQQIKAQAQPVPQTAMPAPTGDPAQDSRNAAAYGFQQQRANAVGAGNQFLTNVGAGLTAASANSVNAANAQRQNLLSQQTQLKGQEGDFRATTLNDMQTAQQQAQQKADTENAKINASLAIASGRLDLAKQILNNVTKPNAQNQQRTARTNARTQRMNAQTQRQNANTSRQSLQLREYTATHPKLSAKGGGAAGSSGFTPTQVRKYASTFRTLSASLDENAARSNPSGAVDALVKGKKTDPVVANAVVEAILNHGSVTKATATLYYRATGQHLHVSPNAVPVNKATQDVIRKTINGNLKNIAGVLNHPLAPVR